MAKETIDNILEAPEFLGIERESSKTYELDLNSLTPETELNPMDMEIEKKQKAAEIIDRHSNDPNRLNEELAKLTKEYESKGDIIIGHVLDTPNGGYLFSKDHQPRYVLFSLRDKNLSPFIDDEKGIKRIVRFSESAGNSHLGIVGGLIGELNKYLGLSIEDIKLHQSHHDEEPTIIDNEALEVKVDGGGFLYPNAKDKEIILSGKSRTFDLYSDSGDYAVKHQLKVHNHAKEVIENWLQDKGFRDYKVKVE